MYSKELVVQYLTHSINCTVWFAMLLFFFRSHNRQCPIRKLNTWLCASMVWTNLVWLASMLALPFIDWELIFDNWTLQSLWIVAYLPMQIVAVTMLTFLVRKGCHNTKPKIISPKDIK